MTVVPVFCSIDEFVLSIGRIVVQLDELFLLELVDLFKIEVELGLKSVDVVRRFISLLRSNGFSLQMIAKLLFGSTNKSSLSDRLLRLGRTKIAVGTMYFSPIELDVSLSVDSNRTSKDARLDLLRNRILIPLIPFRRTAFSLRPMRIEKVDRTVDEIISSLLDNYRRVSVRDLLHLIGNVDLLGQPTVLINDLSDGLRNLVEEHDFNRLVKNLKHGVAHSTSVLTTSLSTSFERIDSDRVWSSPNGDRTSMKFVSRRLLRRIGQPIVGLLDWTHRLASKVEEEQSNEREKTEVTNERSVSLIDCLVVQSILDQLGSEDEDEFVVQRFSLERNQADEDLSFEQVHLDNKDRHSSSLLFSRFQLLLTNKRLLFYRTDDSKSSRFELVRQFDLCRDVTVRSRLEDQCSVEFVFDDPADTTRFNCRCLTVEQRRVLVEQIDRCRSALDDQSTVLRPWKEQL